MTEVKNDSIIKVHYIGSFPDSDEIFDTSREDVAKENNVFNEQREYEPLEVKIGEGQVIPGFEQALIGMKIGDRKIIELSADDAYGHPSPERLVKVGDDHFKEANVEPEVGMMIETSNGIAIISDYDRVKKIVTLDFNHPLSGKDLRFDLELMAIVE